VHVLLGQVPSTAQLAFFASKKEDIRKFSEKYLKNPVVINALRKSFSLNSLKNFYVDVEHHYELDTLIDLLEHTDDNGLSLTAFTCVVVCNTRRKAGWLATKLSAADFDACACVENVHLMDLANSNIFVTTELCLRSIPFQGRNFMEISLFNAFQMYLPLLC
jgi:superfamily II DNA/RNA helicase